MIPQPINRAQKKEQKKRVEKIEKKSLGLHGFNMDMFSDMGTLMGDAALRFKYVEHPTTMLLGAVLITVGNAKSKRAESGQEKAKAVVVWFGIGLALIALRFPWEAFLQCA